MEIIHKKMISMTVIDIVTIADSSCLALIQSSADGIAEFIDFP
jgi:hypothetical protein